MGETRSQEQEHVMGMEVIGRETNKRGTSSPPPQLGPPNANANAYGKFWIEILRSCEWVRGAFGQIGFWVSLCRPSTMTLVAPNCLLFSFFFFLVPRKPTVNVRRPIIKENLTEYSINTDVMFVQINHLDISVMTTNVNLGF